MKEQILKWIKRYGVTVWLIAAILALAVSVSYAAYVNLDINKWVVSTGKGNQAFFGSNYLYLTDRDETLYSERPVPQTPEDSNDPNTRYTFTVQVCNYVYGNPDLVNLDDIHYSFAVKLYPNGLGTLPDGVEQIQVSHMGTPTSFTEEGTLTIGSKTLPGETPTMDSYAFYVPQNLKDQVIFEVTACPTAQSYGATNDQKLAAVITMADQTATHVWTGRFIDDRTPPPSDYSGFNYEISGTGEGTLTLRWNAAVLEISPWFQRDVADGTGGQDGDFKTYTFPVGGADSPSAYQLQFYIADKGKIDTISSWDVLSQLVTVTFDSNS